LGKAITTPSNLEVYPAVAVATNKVVLLDELLWYVREFDTNILRVEHGSIQIEILEINGAEPCALSGEDTVDKDFDQFKGGGVGANVARITNPTSADGDTGAVRIILLWTDFTDYQGVTYLLAFVEWDVMEVDDDEGAGTPYPLFGWRSSRANALAESSELVSVGGIPNGLVTGIATELAMLEEFACSRVQDREGSGVPAVQGFER